MKKTNNKGFSLVELIVVIAIMAVLVGILAPQFLKYVERARKSTDVQNVQAMIAAIDAYAADPIVTDKLSDGSITLTTTATSPADACTASANIDKALTAAGINNIQLRSSNWGTGSKINITITNGVPAYVAANMAEDHNIVTGLYK